MDYRLFLAIRHMKSRGRRFLSFATFVSIIGIALGVAAIIVVMGVMNGFTEEIRSKLLSLKPHILIQKFGPIYEPYPITKKIEKIDGAVATSPVIWGEGIIQYRDRAKGILVKGIDYEKEIKVTGLKKYIKEQISGLDSGVLVGEELAKNLGILDSEEVHLISSQMKKHVFQVKGFFNSGMFEYDNSLVFLSLEDTQKLFGLGDEYSGIQVRINDVFTAEDMKKKIEDVLGSMYIVRTWQDMDRTLFEALKLEKIAMFTILALIVIVASFNIASTLVVMVMEKRRQIGILKAIGATSKDIRRIFLYQGAIMGFFGTILGCIIGFVLGTILKKYHFITLSEEIYSISFLPIKMAGIIFVVVGLLAFFISVLATIYPASRASKLTVAETLRYE
jgi:lipoprotein-releasing system permease protein